MFPVKNPRIVTEVITLSPWKFFSFFFFHLSIGRTSVIAMLKKKTNIFNHEYNNIYKHMGERNIKQLNNIHTHTYQYIYIYIHIDIFFCIIFVVNNRATLRCLASKTCKSVVYCFGAFLFLFPSFFVENCTHFYC